MSVSNSLFHLHRFVQAADHSTAALWLRGCALAVVSALTGLTHAQGPESLELRLSPAAGKPWLETTRLPSHRLQLEASDDLRTWSEAARVNDRLFPYADGSAGAERARFYRVAARPRQAADDWSNQIDAESPQLFKPGTGTGLAGMASVKWSILLPQPDRLYFQDSVVYPFHIQYARARLPGYAGMGAVEFSAQALFPTPAQRMALGSVLRAPDPQVRELAIEVTGAAAFPAAQAADWIDAVRGRLHTPPGWRVVYMPATEQLAETEAHRPLFAARGIEVSSLSRWAAVNACYSEGWAFGRLVFVPSAQIADALGDGRLRLDDILITDRVPAELPVLPGYVALHPATPNSHVALLARSMLLPFAYANGDGLQAEIASLQGREVLLTVEDSAAGCRIALQDTTGLLTPERRQEIIDSQRRSLTITPKATRGVITLPADSLTPADIQYVGGKAANFGFLRRSLPEDSPHPALALTFDLWDAYLAQSLTGGGSLLDFIRSRLSRHTYPPNIAALRADLSDIRNAVEQVADFTPTQRTTLIAALQSAGLQGAKIRFRSSTNVEDGETFNGAGLYDSFSGCLEDDIDGETTGPSHCDPTEPNERGIFRALRKVFASFYNENAVLERLRYSLDESKAGMAVLVHFSSPDSQEMANGVATLAVDTTDGERHATLHLVSQLGATSVTNPDAAVRPEVVRARFNGPDPATAEFTIEEVSSLTQNGSPVMVWLDDYRTLLAQLHTAALAYEAYDPSKSQYELDFEYKKLLPGRVGLKQIRTVPHPVPVPPPSIP